MDIIHYFFEAKRISGEDCVRKVKKKKKKVMMKFSFASEKERKGESWA